MRKKIAEILTLKPKARDNDFYLMYWMWRDEFYILNKDTQLELDFDKTNIVNILSMLKDRKLSHPSGIMRARRKLQEEHPSLRGEVWKIRHKEQAVVKKDLGYKWFAQ